MINGNTCGSKKYKNPFLLASLHFFSYFFTARNEIGARLCFYTYLWFCSQGGVPGQVPPGQVPPGQVHSPWAGTHPPGQVHLSPAMHAGIWSTNGQYASYWNAFLLFFSFFSFFFWQTNYFNQTTTNVKSNLLAISIMVRCMGIFFTCEFCQSRFYFCNSVAIYIIKFLICRAHVDLWHCSSGVYHCQRAYILGINRRHLGSQHSKYLKTVDNSHHIMLSKWLKTLLYLFDLRIMYLENTSRRSRIVFLSLNLLTTT